LGSPFDLTNRVAGLGISTLTMRVAEDPATFILDVRDAAHVTHNARR